MADSERTETATPRRRIEARNRGQVAKSPEVNTALLLLVSFIALKYLAPLMFNGIKEITAYCFLNLGTVTFSEQSLAHYGLKLMLAVGAIVVPFILVIMVVAIVVNIAQVGFMHSTHAIKPQLTRINPISGFKRIFSYRILVELLKTVIKVTITVWIAYAVIRPEFEKLILTMDMAPTQSVGYISLIVIRLGIQMGLVFAFFATADYFYQKWEYEKSLKMTKQEIKEELIRFEGRPEVRQRIRSIQRQLAMRRMMQEVPKADVVITNPTHLAIALKYDPQEMVAPQVVAKGARLVAKRIIEIAKENKVPIMENKPLAQMLFKLVDINQFIPLQLYQAVADILAFVWRSGKLKKKFF